jgi:transcriptional regulator with XRE-family HTH domain
MRDDVDFEQMSQTLADNLTRLIGATSHQEIAERVGISRSALYNILQGTVDPRLSTVQALADVLGKPIGALTGEAVEPAGVSREAEAIARLYDALDPEDRAFVWRFLRKLAPEPPSPQ